MRSASLKLNPQRENDGHRTEDRKRRSFPCYRVKDRDLKKNGREERDGRGDLV